MRREGYAIVGGMLAATPRGAGVRLGKSAVAHPYWLAYLLALAVAASLAMIQPGPPYLQYGVAQGGVINRVWYGNDEANHLDLVAQYANGVYPRVDTLLRPETVVTIKSAGFEVPAFVAMPPNMSPAAERTWLQQHYSQLSYEAVQPPLFYLAAVPAWWAGQWVGGPLGSLRAVRLFNALILALLAPLGLGLMRQLMPGKSGVEWAVVALTALMPGYILNGSHVTNDNLAAVIGGAALLLMARRVQQGWSRWSVFWAGLLVGLATLSKLTAAGLVIALVVAVLASRQSSTWRKRGWQLGLAGVGGLIPVLPWLLLNKLLLGDFTQQAAASLLQEKLYGESPVSLGYFLAEWVGAFASFWTGIVTVPTKPMLVELGVMAGLGVFSVLGLVRLARKGEQSERRVLLICVAAVLGQLIVTVLAAASIQSGSFIGRYSYPALAAILCLLAAGLWRELPARRAKVTSVGVYAVASAFFVVVQVLGLNV